MKVSGKRLAAAALSMALVLSLSSCGKGTETKKPENSPSPAPVVTPTPEPTPTPAADPEEAVRTYWSEDQLTQAWGPNQVVEHLFFHPVIAYPQWAFHDCQRLPVREGGAGRLDGNCG